MIPSFVKRIGARLTGNRPAQKAMEFLATKSQYLMGIGSASEVHASGEIAVIKMLSRFCSPPYCVFDVGANEGQFLKLVLSNVDAHQATVHCFEPALHTFRALSEAAAGAANVVLNNFGLGKERGVFTLFYDRVGSGSASLTKRRLDHFGVSFSEQEQVKIDTIDEYCREKGIDRIDLLKIDVEGHELDVLQGASNMFAKGAVALVDFEFGGCNIDTRTFFQDFYYWAERVKMKLYRITPSGYAYPLVRYSEVCEQFRTTNYLAVNTEIETRTGR